MSEPWNTEMWFTSPWNFDGEVRKQVKFDPNPRFHDVTLRDGEQQAGVIFSKDDKIRIAEALAEVGIHRIEAGMPVVSKSDEAAIREIVKRYAREAGIEKRIYPHLFRHQLLTHLARKGVIDTKVQVISGHGDRKSLALYQELSLADVEEDYQEAMKDFPVK